MKGGERRIVIHVHLVELELVTGLILLEQIQRLVATAAHCVRSAAHG